MTHAIRHLVDPMQIVTMELALAYPNIKAILILDVVQNVFSIQTVHGTKHAFEINVSTLVQAPVDKMLFVMLSTMFQCAVVRLVWRVTHS